ncbi:MAG: hypothetical protein ACJ79L_01585 [Anaeromyxobacteraceae bacterium]
MTEGTPERALAGLGAFSRKLAIGTLIAIALAWAGWTVFMAGEGPSATSAVRPERSAAESKGPTPNATPSVRPERSTAESKGEDPTSPISAAIERRHAEGALQEAVKRFPPCPGGDVRRTAWIDGDSVVKLAREKADGTQVEEWFDRGGRLREAIVRGRSGAAKFTRRVVLDERGAPVLDATAPAGVVLDAPLPPLQREDPSAGFFGGPGCVR